MSERDVISRVHLVQGAVHDRLRVWSRGGLAGALTVGAGDGVRIMARLSRDWHRIVDTYRSLSFTFLEVYTLASQLRDKLDRLETSGETLSRDCQNEFYDALFHVIQRAEAGHKIATHEAIATEKL